MRTTKYIAVCALAILVAAGWTVSAQPKEQVARVRIQLDQAGAPQPAVGPVAAEAAEDDADDADNDAGATDADAAPRAALMTTLDGDRVRCRVLGIEPDGRLRFTADWLTGEASAQTGSLKYVRFGGKHKVTGAYAVTITNGDVLIGSLQAITEESIVLTSEVLGTVTIARKFVQSIERGESMTMLVESDFSDGEMGPWKALQGDWSISGGWLVCSGGNRQPFAIAAPVEQKGAITIEMDMQAMMPWNMQYQLVFFADTTQNNQGQNSILIYFHSNGFYAQTISSQRGHQQFANGQFNFRGNNNTPPKGKVRVAYDPEDQKMTVWIKGNRIGQYTVPNGPKTGKHIILRIQYGEKTRLINVYRGIVPPGKDAGVTGGEQTETIMLANGDRFSAQSLVMSEGVITATIAGTEIRFQADTLRELGMRTASIEKPRRRKGDVTASTGRGRATVKLDHMTDEYLVGESGYAGQLQIRRDALRRIDFNIYRRPTPDEDASTNSGSATPGPGGRQVMMINGPVFFD